MRRFINKLFRSARSLVIADVDRELEQLKGFVAERGSEVGLRNLPPEDSIKAIEAAIRLIAEKRFGPLAPPEDFFERAEARLRSNLALIESKIDAHQARQKAEPVSQISPMPQKPIRWVVAIGNVVVIFGLIGLALEACGIKLGKQGYAALMLCGAFVLLNLTNGPTIAHNSLARIGYWLACFNHYLVGCRLRIRAWRLDKRIRKLNQQRETGAVRRHIVEEWIAQTRQDMLGHFEFYRARAAEAARMIADNDQRLTAALEPERKMFEHGGIRERAPQPEGRKRESAAFSAFSALSV